MNKAALRQMRKFYSNIFKKNNPKIVRRRFCNAKSSEVKRAIKSIVENEFGSVDCFKDLQYYLLGILKIKDILRMNWNNTIKSEVMDFIEWIRDYSSIKFTKLFKSKWLRILCKHFISKNERNDKMKSLIQIIK